MDPLHKRIKIPASRSLAYSHRPFERSSKLDHLDEEPKNQNKREVQDICDAPGPMSPGQACRASEGAAQKGLPLHHHHVARAEFLA